MSAHLSNDDLVQRFVAIGMQRHEAAFDLDTKTYNKLVDKTGEVFDILKARGEVARRMLVPLMDHDNAGVRLAAATMCLAIEPARARTVLQSFDGDEEMQERLMGSSILFLVDKGQLTPP